MTNLQFIKMEVYKWLRENDNETVALELAKDIDNMDFEFSEDGDKLHAELLPKYNYVFKWDGGIVCLWDQQEDHE